MTSAKKFGTFAGVYTPSVLTILGVIMYMRMGWIVGNTTPFEFIIVVLFSHIISLTTGLSVSSIATDKKIKAGGIYYMLSRSLGLPIGGAIGLTIFVGTALSIALYLIGFSESFNEVTGWLGSTLNDYRITASATLLLITVLAFISTSIAIKTQFFILGFIILSLVSIFMGEFNPEAGVAITEAASSKANLSMVFAIFFPAVTGFTAGVAMSGDLENPKKSIPYGTMLSIGTGLIVYFALGIFLRYSIPEEYLRSDYGILLKFAAWSPLLIAGIWGATVSSALGGILGAPRILQALSIDKITPRLFGKGVGESNEPRNALILTFILAEAGILIGELDVIAEIVSMFYLAAYGFINLACFLESWASTDFLPKFKIPKWVSLTGFFFTFIVMAYLNLIAMLVALVLIGGIFVYLTRKEIALGSGDVWQSVWSSLIKVALKRIHLKDEHKRNWKPNILLFSGGTSARPHLIDFGRSVAGKNGMISNFDLEENSEAETLFPKSRQLIKDELFEQYGIFSVHQEVQSKFKAIESIAETYGFTGVEPNTILMGWGKNTKDPIWFAQMTQRLKSIDYNILYLDYDKERGFGQKETIDIWWDHFGDSADLTLQLVKLIQKSSDWRKAHLRLFVINNNFNLKDVLQVKIGQLLSNLRLDAEIMVINNYQNETQYTLIESYSSESDLIFVELPEVIKAEKFVQDTNELFKHVGTTLLVGASSHFSEVISFETKDIEQQSSTNLVEGNKQLKSEVLLEVESLPIEFSNSLIQFDKQFQQLLSEFNEEIDNNIFSFYNSFQSLKGEKLKAFVLSWEQDSLALQTKEINSALQQLIQDQIKLLFDQPKYIVRNLSKSDLENVQGDSNQEKRAKRWQRFKSKFGAKQILRVRYKNLLRYYFNYQFLPDFNKTLLNILLNETLLFWNLNHDINNIDQVKLEVKQSVLNSGREFVNLVAKELSKVSVNSNLEELEENARASRLKKEFKTIATFSSIHERHLSRFLASLEVKSLLNISLLRFTDFINKITKTKNESIDRLKKELKSIQEYKTDLDVILTLGDIVRDLSQKFRLNVSDYDETLSVIPKSEFIRFENEVSSIESLDFSYLNYLNHLKEEKVKHFLIEETFSFDTNLQEKHNAIQNLVAQIELEQVKDKPNKTTVKDLEKSLKIAVSEMETFLDSYNPQVEKLIDKVLIDVQKQLSIEYLFEHIQEVNTKVIKINQQNAIKSAIIWASDKTQKFSQQITQGFDSFLGKLLEKQKANQLLESIGSVAHYQNYFNSRTTSKQTLNKLPFAYRAIYQKPVTDPDLFFGRQLELELAQEAILNLKNGIGGVMVVSGEIKSGKTSFINALLSKEQNVERFTISTEELLTARKFESEFLNPLSNSLTESNQKIIVIDNLEKVLMLKNVSTIISKLSTLIKEHSNNHVIILTFNHLFLEHLKTQYQFANNIFINIQLQSFSVDDIHKVIWLRHRRSSLALSYNNDVDDSSITERLRMKISKSLYRQSGGNIGVACAMWLGAISYKNGFDLNYNLFKSDIENLSKMDWLLTLEKLYINNGLFRKQIIGTRLEEQIKVLNRSGIVEEIEERYLISNVALKLVNQSLDINGIR